MDKKILINEANAFLHYHDNKYITEGAKDEMRINDIISKSHGNKAKENQLAQIMATRITGLEKAEARYNAAVDILGIESDIAQIFAKRAQELGSKNIKPEEKEEFGKQFKSSWLAVRKPNDKYTFTKGDVFNQKNGYNDNNQYVVGFDDPWAAYFYDDYCGQISDGAWEDSPRFEKNDYWRNFYKIKAVYGSQYNKGNIGQLLYKGIANATAVSEYADVNLKSFAKCYVLKNHLINKLINEDPDEIQSNDDIDKLKTKTGVDYLYIEAWLYEPGISNPEKALKLAYANINKGLHTAINERENV